MTPAHLVWSPGVFAKTAESKRRVLGRPGVPGWAVTFAMTEHSERRSQVRGLVGKFNQWVIYRSVSGM